MSSSTNTETKKGGAYNRNASKHRNLVVPHSSLYPPDSDRYHLHISLACPWACGTLAMLHLKGLDYAISHSIVHPTWGKTKPDDDEDKHHGWVYRSKGDPPMSNPLGHGSFTCDDDALRLDTHTGARNVREVYETKGNDFMGPFTTPLLYDKKTNTLVNNESTEILPMLNSQFNDIAKHPDLDFYPEDLQEELDELNKSIVYPKVNNGVYKCGFARSQEAYDVAVTELFEALDFLEEKLSTQRYLGGEGTRFTWLDLRLFMTLVRFDPVYITYFKTNQKRLVDYPNLLGYTRDIYAMEEIRKVINMDHIKTHYYTSHPVHNTFGIIPVYNGPDLTVPSGRESM